jgi:ubiquinone/menaquinone biosynthesis C-methylase UbiE
LYPQPEDNILELGCGTGNLLKKILTETACQRLTGADFSENMLHRAREKCVDDRLTLIQADANSLLPFSDNTFSKVVFINTLYALKAPLETLKEVYRVVEPNGEVVIVTPKKGFDDGMILKEHAESNKPDSFWADPHSSPEREEMLIRATIDDEILVQQMLFVAHHNRSILKNATFNFFTLATLTELIKNSGFTINKIDLVYADQEFLVHARK